MRAGFARSIAAHSPPGPRLRTCSPWRATNRVKSPRSFEASKERDTWRLRTMNNAHFIADAKLLLPWRATGRLSAAEVDVTERAFALAPKLKDDLAAARRERQAVIAVNELTPAPSSRALE